MQAKEDKIGVLEFFKCKKESTNQIPLFFKIRVKKGADIIFIKYQDLKVNHPQILIEFFQKKMLITSKNPTIKEVISHENPQSRLNSMIQSYEDTLQGLNLLQNGHLTNNEPIENFGVFKRKKQILIKDSKQATKKFRDQKQIIPQLEEQKGAQRNSSKKKVKKQKNHSQQKTKKINYNQILQKRVGQNYQLFYFPAYLSLSSIKKPLSKQKNEKKESKPVKKIEKSPLKKSQPKKTIIKPESDSDSLDITFTDSDDEQNRSKNKKKFR